MKAQRSVRMVGAGSPLTRAMLLAGCLLAWPVQAQTSGSAMLPEIAQQKARMLESFFVSGRLREALASNPDAAGPLAAEARVKLTAGHEELKDGHFSEAIAMFDAAIRALSEAVELGSSESDQQTRSPAFEARRQQAESLLTAIESANDVSARTRVEALRGRLSEAGRRFEAGEKRDAREALEAAYLDVVRLVAEVRHGHSLFVTRTFGTAEEAYEYERERHKSYVLLVELALAERGESDGGLSSLAERLTAEGEELRATAEGLAAAGEHGPAIKSMKRATERLAAVLRAAGLIMMD